MDKEIKTLEKIGLAEVCKRTHIEVKQLHYMINNEYDKLNKINTLGFVKILSREYRLDLSEWLDGFQAYLAQHQSDEEGDKAKIFIHAKPEEGGIKKRWFFLMILMLVGGFGYYMLGGKLPDVMQWIPSWTMTSSSPAPAATPLQDPPVVKEAAKSIGVVVEERVVETNSTNASVQNVVVMVETNQSEPTEVNNTGVTPQTPTSQESNLTQEPRVTHAIIVPKRKMWLGVVSLENGKRKESTNDHNLSIDLHKRQLIKTGHGYFEVVMGEHKEAYTDKGATRFLVENGTMQPISEELFIQLNGGKNW